MKQLKTNKVLFSAFQNNRPEYVNEDNHASLLVGLKAQGLNPIETTGVWLGKRERSILLESTNVIDHNKHLDVAYGIMNQFNQDAILEVHNDDKGVLHFSNGVSDVIGTLKVITDIVGVQGYTLINETGTIFTFE